MPQNAGYAWRRRFGRQVQVPWNTRAANPGNPVTWPLPVLPGRAWLQYYRRHQALPWNVAPARQQYKPGPGPVQVVQSAQGISLFGATGVQVQFPQPTAAGNCVILLVSNASGSTALSAPKITLGTSADAFTLVANKNAAAISDVWADYNCSGGQVFINAAGGTSVAANAWLATAYEISGVAASGATDQTAGSSVAATSWSSGQAPLTSQASEIYLGLYGAYLAGSTWTVTPPASPWVTASQFTFGGPSGEKVWSVTGYQIATGQGTPQFAGTASQSPATNAIVVVTLKAANPSANVTGTPPAAPGWLWRKLFLRRQAPFIRSASNYGTLPAAAVTTATVTEQPGKSLAGAIATSGAVASQASRMLSAAVTTAGALARQPGRLVAAAVTTAAALTRAAARVLAVTVTTTGALGRQAGRALAGSVTSAASLSRQCGRALSAAVTTAGALARAAARSLAATVTTGAAIIAARTLRLALAGTVATAGAISRGARKILAAVAATAGKIAASIIRGPVIAPAQVTITTAVPVTVTITQAAPATVAISPPGAPGTMITPPAAAMITPAAPVTFNVQP